MITAELRETVRQLYLYRCGYCGVSEVGVGHKLELDHFHPVSRGGDDHLENLVYCCAACNRFKSSFWAARDVARRLLHPLRDDLTLHVRAEADGWLMALTETGQCHLDILHLNRSQLRSQRIKRALTEQFAGRLARLNEEGTQWNSLTATGRDELFEMLRILYRLPNE